MKDWQPVDVIILILVILISIILLLAITTPMLNLHGMKDNTSKLLAGVLGSIISVISMYIGAKIKNNNCK